MLEEFLWLISCAVLVLLWGWTFLVIANEVVQALYRYCGPRIYGPAFDERTPWYIYPVARFTYPCYFCGAPITVSRPLGRYTPPMHTNCDDFMQTLQSSVENTDDKAGKQRSRIFLGADEAVLRRSVFEIDPDAELRVIIEQLGHMAVFYRVKVRSRSLIKSAKKE
jgi:hypothetical protein